MHVLGDSWRVPPPQSQQDSRQDRMDGGNNRYFWIPGLNCCCVCRERRDMITVPVEGV